MTDDGDDIGIRGETLRDGTSLVGRLVVVPSLEPQAASVNAALRVDLVDGHVESCPELHLATCLPWPGNANHDVTCAVRGTRRALFGGRAPTAARGGEHDDGCAAREQVINRVTHRALRIRRSVVWRAPRRDRARESTLRIVHFVRSGRVR